MPKTVVLTLPGKHQGMNPQKRSEKYERKGLEKYFSSSKTYIVGIYINYHRMHHRWLVLNHFLSIPEHYPLLSFQVWEVFKDVLNLLGCTELKILLIIDNPWPCKTKTGDVDSSK